MIEVDPYDLTDDQSEEVTRLIEEEIAARPKQTIFDGENGNCLQACVATITRLPMDAVPNFSTFREKWFDALLSWADARGYEMMPVNPKHWDAPVLAFGQSPRGIRHAVVWDGDSMMHDPHPDGAGLVSVEDEFWAITDRLPW